MTCGSKPTKQLPERQNFSRYTQSVLKFTKLITEAQQREAVTQGRSLLPIPATV
ncbi:MAG: hypothetical protein LBL62_03925 [Planctomycetaceae bacterium]|nr:hypothetical protein [Planctomycetaceae bacterium]